jgi:glutamyl-tRNA reductase
MPDKQAELLRQAVGSVTEAMVISTCNRVEFYAAHGSPEDARLTLRSIIVSVGGAQLAAHLYEHLGDAALIHLFRVAASLDSMVLGEPQILGQVKDALELAQKAGSAGGELTRACAAAFASAKRVRSETAIGRTAVSMASAAVELATKVFGSLAGRSVLLVGAGEMAELAGKHLRAAGADQIAVANRNPVRARELADAVQGVATDFEAIHSQLIWADLVICSTASPIPLFTKPGVAAAVRARRFRPLFMVDLAVPRDIAANVNELEGVYAYDVDDIQRVVSDNASGRLAEAAKAEVIVAEEVARFVRFRSLRDGTPVLAQLRARAEQIARAEVERTLNHLGEALTEKQRRSIQAMASAIINKLLHEPTTRLRELGGEEDRHRLAGAAAELFGLESSVATRAEGGGAENQVASASARGSKQ